MNLSKLKINLFFLTVVLLGWYLYPKDLFLGYLHEGQEDISQSEAYYLEYLQKWPNSKKAVMRLAQMYERAAQPEKGAVWLQKLVDHRTKDWDLAEFYLDYLENMHDEEGLYRARIRLAGRMLEDRGVSRKRLESTLNDVFEYALWKQDYEQAYEAMRTLCRIRPINKDCADNIENLDWGLKKTQALLETYERKIIDRPDDLGVLEELVGLYRVVGKHREAYVLLDERLKKAPRDTHLWLLRTYLDEDLNKYEELVRDLETVAAQAEDPLWKETLQRLINAHTDAGDPSRALPWAMKLLGSDDSAKEHWLAALSLLQDMRDWDGTLSLLDSFEKKFPGEDLAQELRFSIWLYEKKEWNHLDFYRSYVHKTLRRQAALDVAYLLKEKKQDAYLIDWILSLVPKFPTDEDLILLLSETYAAQKKWDLALKALERIPNPSSELVLNKVFVLTNLARKAQALDLLEDLSKRREKGLSLKIGREFLFLGHPKKAVSFLKKAVLESPRSFEAHFWLAEAYYSTLQPSLAAVHHRKVVEILGEREKRNRDEELVWLKSKGRLEGSRFVAVSYEKRFQSHPRDADFQTDWLDLLLEEGRYRDASAALGRFKRTDASTPGRWLPYEVRLAFGEGKWSRAADLLEEILKLEPHQYAYRRDLADAYLKQGLWKKASREVLAVRAVTNDDLDVSPFTREIHERFDDQVRFEFDFSKSGGERFFKESLWARRTLKDGFYLIGGTEAGQFSSDFIARDVNLWGGFLGAGAYVWEGWHLEGRLRAAFTEERSVFSPRILLESPQGRDFQVSLLSYFRDMGDDLASLAARGDVQSGFRLQANYVPQERITLGLQGALARHDLSSGPESLVLSLTPSLTYQIWAKPRLYAGYEYHFEDAGDAAWVAATGYLDRVNAHYLTLGASYDFDGRFFVEAGGFIGEDFTRDLHLHEGDLWGAHAGLQWWPRDWLEVRGRYEFGRETLTTVSGQSHRFLLGIGAHWW